jgi:hypothetical protein
MGCSAKEQGPRPFSRFEVSGPLSVDTQALPHLGYELPAGLRRGLESQHDAVMFVSSAPFHSAHQI